MSARTINPGIRSADLFVAPLFFVDDLTRHQARSRQTSFDVKFVQRHRLVESFEDLHARRLERESLTGHELAYYIRHQHLTKLSGLANLFGDPA